MCLSLRDKQPRVDKKDITILKYVRVCDNFITSPYQHTKIPVNEVMTASPKKEEIDSFGVDLLGNNSYYLSGGAIHAKLIKDGLSEFEGRKAIIPSGTEYWVSVQGDEIAARSMIITDINWDNGDNKVSEIIFEEILENAPEVNGIRIGDYLLENGDYTRPQKGLSEDNVVGIIAGFHEGKPLIVALKSFVGVYNMLYYSQIGEFYNVKKEPIKAFNGRSITKKYKEGDRNNVFQAFEACINYRKDKDEEWYFGALGEVATMINNCIYLNAAHQITGLGFIIGDELYCSCSESGYDGSWGCYLYGSKVLHGLYCKLSPGRVVPFLASKDFKN